MESITGDDESDTAGRAEIRASLIRLDLNLLLALDALLDERSVTRAAERLALSQPALSASLAKLRLHFGDPLLVRHGRQHELTPLAARLSALSAGALTRLHTIFASTAAFDPAQERREFVIHGSDYSALTLGARVRQLIDERAPHVRLRFVLYSAGGYSAPSEILGASDGVILPHGYLFDIPHLDVIADEWVCLVSADNDEVGDRLELDDLVRLPWVSNYPGGDTATPASRQLELLGIRPRVDTVVDGFLTLPYFVAGTRRLAFIQRSLAESFPPSMGVRWLPAPFEANAHQSALWWHPVHDLDPAHRWLREMFRIAATRDG